MEIFGHYSLSDVTLEMKLTIAGIRLFKVALLLRIGSELHVMPCVVDYAVLVRFTKYILMQ